VTAGPARSGTVVVKLGGDVIADRASLANVCAGVRGIVGAGARTAIVHGGGPQATALSKRLGVEAQVVAGRRVTDEATLEVMKMAVAGQVNVDLSAALRAAGVRAVGVAGVSAGLVDAVKRPPRVVTGAGPEPIDLGLVGDVVVVSLDLLGALWRGGFVPVIACLGSDASGQVYNINADVVANAVAGAITADHLLVVTGAPGILADPDDPSTRIPRLTLAEARAAIAAGTIRGGMIPKVEECAAGLAKSVRAVHVLAAATPDALLHELQSPGTVGTVLVAG
jgi:acetylglutamate kinase